MILILILVAVLVLVTVAAAGIAYLVLRGSMRNELNELRTALYKHTQSSQQPAEAQPEVKPAAPAPVVKEAAKEAPKAAPAPAPAPVVEEIPAEVLAVIAAAVAHFCGIDARIRSARLAPTTGTSAWAQWGRASIQASHNLPAQRAHA